MSTPKLLMFLAAGLVIACGGDSGNYEDYARADLRYYAYAPPLIPHKVLNRDCLACHADGLVVEGRKARVTPHPEFVNCQQCHVRADDGVELFKGNTFVGIKEPSSLGQPQPAGPPLIPHRVFMRENCVVCHNDNSRQEIVQTTHPERTNCQQCHVEQNAEVVLFKKNTNMADAFR